MTYKKVFVAILEFAVAMILYALVLKLWFPDMWHPLTTMGVAFFDRIFFFSYGVLVARGIVNRK